MQSFVFAPLTDCLVVKLDDWQTAYDKAAAFVDSLSLADKARVVTGRNATANGEFFPGLNIMDGQQGILNSFFVTGWSEPGALTMSWDKEALYKQSYAIAREFYIRGYHVVDGPTVSPGGRTAWNGRASEGFAADSYLTGVAFGESVRAEVDAGTISAGKHFLLYEQENNRTNVAANEYNFTSYNSLADDKTIHETYLAPWYDGVKNGLGGAMCAMNLVNGSYSCENEPLLMGLLKEEVGFPGLVVPDINGQKTVDGSANGGLDWASDQLWTPEIIEDLVSSGNVSEARINDMAIRNIVGWYHSNLNNGFFPTKAEDDEYRPIPKTHRELNRENGGKSIVLLKNKDSALPLKSPRVVSVFGASAGATTAGPNQAFAIANLGPGSYRIPEVLDGHVATLSGAGKASMQYLVTPLQALQDRAREDQTQFRWIANDTFTPVSQGFIAGGASTGVRPSIPAYASFSDACIVFLNAYGGEGQDRLTLSNEAQDNLVLEVAQNCQNTIVVVNTVGIRLVDKWIEHDNVTAVLYSGPLGQESGNAIADVLYGSVNPSAKLVYTIARKVSDYDIRPCPTVQCEFSEGNYIDYKAFDRNEIEPRFEFGFGLSYSTFEYSKLSINNLTAEAGVARGPPSVGGRADLWDEVASVSIRISNTGDVKGTEIAQLYLTFPEAADQPVRQLRGFDKVTLEPGETKTAIFTLHRRDMSFWDVGAQNWRLASGTYGVSVGRSSRKFEAEGEIKVGSRKC